MSNTHDAVYIDLNTGQEFYTDRVIQDGIAQYKSIQLSPAYVWVLPHNQNTTKFILKVKDVYGNQISPYSIRVTDTNTITITFSSPTAGSVILILFDTNGGGSLPITPTPTPTASTLGNIYDATILAKNPIAYWPFNTDYVDVIGGIVLTNSNSGSLPSNFTSLLPDSFGNQLLLSNGSSGTNMSSTIPLQFNYSMETWIKLNSATVNTYPTIFGTDSYGIQYGINGANVIDIFIDSDNDGSSGPDFNFIVGETYHIILTVDANGIPMWYINGTPYVDGSTDPLTETYNYMFIGKDTGDGDSSYLFGTIGNPAIYDYVLTAEQALENYNAGIHGYRYASGQQSSPTPTPMPSPTPTPTISPTATPQPTATPTATPASLEPLTFTVPDSGAFPMVIGVNTSLYTTNQLIGVINWGDGATTNVLFDGSTEYFPTHTYDANGPYTATFAGNVVSVKVSYYGTAYTLDSWGDYDISKISLNSCTSVPALLSPKITDASNMLQYNPNPLDISGWDTSNVTDMSYMCQNSTNNDVSGFNTSNVINMREMFAGTTTFNQDISGWDTSNVTNMQEMFENASAFNQDLSGWCVANIPTEQYNFSSGATAWVLPQPIWGTCYGTYNIPDNLLKIRPVGVIDRSYRVVNDTNTQIRNITKTSDNSSYMTGVISGMKDINGISFHSYGNIVKFNSDSTLDFSFVTSANNTTKQFCQTSDGKIYLGGSFSSINGTPYNGLARLNSDGSLDSTFVDLHLDYSAIGDICESADGKIYVTGYFYVDESLYYLCRLNADGTLDTTYDSSKFQGYSMIKTADDKLYLAGAKQSGTSGSIVDGQYIIRLNSDGSVDSTFAYGADNNVNNAYILFQSNDGKIYLGNSVEDTSVSAALIRFNSDGTVDNTFNTIFTHSVVSVIAIRTIYQTSDGKIYVGGTFNRVNGETYNGVARLNSDGTLDTTFNNFDTSLTDVTAISQSFDDGIYIAY